MPWMYILQCADGSYYVGSTMDLDRRLWQHEQGIGASYTATRLPVTLVYSEEFSSVREAFQREKQVQGWSRAKREALIRGDFGALPDLSKKTPGITRGELVKARGEPVKARVEPVETPSPNAG